jgi:acyl-coenzyme A synthetase/AMP-(fatty) acid ligase
LTFPGVADVSVVGVPDAHYGEVVAAFVIWKQAHQNTEEQAETGEKLRKFVREKLSAHLGRSLFFFLLIFRTLGLIRAVLILLRIVPKYIFFLEPTDSFPKTASGKIQKFKLKETAIKLLGGH